MGQWIIQDSPIEMAIGDHASSCYRVTWIRQTLYTMHLVTNLLDTTAGGKHAIEKVQPSQRIISLLGHYMIE